MHIFLSVIKASPSWREVRKEWGPKKQEVMTLSRVLCRALMEDDMFG